MKIVTLLPSATEIVCRLGLEKNLVGRSHECDYPESITHLPVLTKSKVNAKADSGTIHNSVLDILKNSISVYDLDLELLKELQPDFVITQDLCDVCAVSFDQVDSACKEFFGESTEIISLRPNRLQDIWDDIQRVAGILGARSQMIFLDQEIQGRIAFVQDNILASSSARRRKRILTIEWMDPVMIGGLWVPDMIKKINGKSLLAKSGEKAQTVNRETLMEIDPQVVVIKPCGFDLEQTQGELGTLKNNIPWDQWSAVKNGQAYIVDGNAYFNRPGPRIIESIEILGYCAFPEVFPTFKNKFKDEIIQLTPEFCVP